MGWANVWHANAPAETVDLPAVADAVLFNYTHDICRTPVAVANILRQTRPGARIAMAGIKYFPWWTGPLNLLAWLKNRPYNARPADMWQPWSLVAAQCDGFSWSSTQWGMGYIGSGIYKGEPIMNTIQSQAGTGSSWPVRVYAGAALGAVTTPAHRFAPSASTASMA